MSQVLTGTCGTDAVRYNKLCGSLRSLIHRLSLLPAEDPYRQQKETEMLNKLYDMGILGRLWHFNPVKLM